MVSSEQLDIYIKASDREVWEAPKAYSYERLHYIFYGWKKRREGNYNQIESKPKDLETQLKAKPSKALCRQVEATQSPLV